MNGRMKERSEGGRRHTRGCHDHAATRGVGMAQALQAHHEENRSNKVSSLKKQLAVAHFFPSAAWASFRVASFLWNILSIRSVIRNPPVTLIMAEVTAVQSKIEDSV